MLTTINLAQIGRISHGFFTRRGGISQGLYASLNCGPGSGDSRDAVMENRRRCVSALTGNGAASLVTLYQVHSSVSVRVDSAWEPGQTPKADAMASRVTSMALGVLTADCAPVLLADEEAGVIGAAHAGWRGALSGIVESVVTAMQELGACRGRIAAAVGPCIGQANYEVADDFRMNFLDAEGGNARFFVGASRTGHWQFDLEAYVVECLSRAGVQNVAASAVCTYAQEGEFFSFRRSTHRAERDYGRQLSAIMLL